MCGNKIIGIGAESEINKLIGPETVMHNLSGKTVVPGFIDSHAHLIHYGISATHMADLNGCRSISEIQERLRAFRKSNPHSQWLTGRGFDQELLEEHRWPNRADLDAVSADIPIVIIRVCTHALVANSAAMARINENLPAQQLETGIFSDGSTELIWEQIPSPTPSESKSAALWALNDAARLGLTSVHCIIHNREDFEVMQALHSSGNLPVRIYLICPFEMLNYLSEQGLQTGSGDERLRIGAIKIYLDGSMGARTAAMIEPYTDAPETSGVLIMNERKLAKLLTRAQEKGFQAAIHAIGDRAVETAVNAIEAAGEFGNSGNVLRHRIEHASVLNAELIDKMARLNILASVQPQFTVSDFWTSDRIGRERCNYWHPFKTMLQAGITLGTGSDCPIESLNPVRSLYAAVNRGSLNPDEGLSVLEALRASSTDNAYLSFQENQLGTIKPGMLADFAVLSDDPFIIDPKELGDLRVEMTVVGGQPV